MAKPVLIETVQDYLKLFPDKEKALEYAIQERRFEIELYWKRATYIITLNAAALTAFFLAASLEDEDAQYLMMVLIGVFGMIVSFAAIALNLGGKFWQEHWERKVELLENEVIGPLYKTATDRDSITSWDTRFPFSVTKSNLLATFLLFGMWFVLTTCKIGMTTGWLGAAAWIVIVGILLLVLARLMLSREEPNVRINCVVRELEDSDGTARVAEQPDHAAVDPDADT